MSKLTTAAVTSHALSVTAMEEASRRGDRTVGIDYLILALIVNEQVAGQVLRSFGITLDEARETIDTQHTEQLSSLGIHADAPAPGPIMFHETGDFEWSGSALVIMKRSAARSNTGDAAAVLRELLVEPSGLIDAILQRLGTTPDAVRVRLDDAERYPARRQHTFDASSISGTSESFVPAQPSAIWELLAAPTRMAEWDPSTGSIENAPARIEVGSTWLTHAPTELPDGTPNRVKPAYRTAQVEITDIEPLHRIEWLFTRPDAPEANLRRIRIELEPAAGGTQLLLSSAWVPSPASRRRRIPLRWMLRPAHRFFMWMQLSQLSSSISRALR